MTPNLKPEVPEDVRARAEILQSEAELRLNERLRRAKDDIDRFNFLSMFVEDNLRTDWAICVSLGYNSSEGRSEIEKFITANSAHVFETRHPMRDHPNYLERENLKSEFIRQTKNWIVTECDSWRIIQGQLAKQAQAELEQAQRSTHNDAEPVDSRPYVDERHRALVVLLERILADIGIESFVTEFPNLKRTSVMDYKACRIAGKVGSKKRRAIEDAIQLIAKRLGLPTRTYSD